MQPQPILRLTTLHELEQRHLNVTPPLMERAGKAAAEIALRLAGNSLAPPLIVAGPGNNGGDAFVVARLLKQAGCDPLLVFAGDAARLPADARAACDAWLASGGSLQDDLPEGNFSIAVDGLFGIGLSARRPLEGRHAMLVRKLNSLNCPILALDIPSGLDAETGFVPPGDNVVRATHTATFIALKPGLLTLDGPDHCGEISLHNLGLDIDDAMVDGHTIARTLFTGQLRPRLKNSHKGSYGSVGIIGGATGMAGAALLAGRAALKLGAGRVYVGMLERLAVDPQQPELMLRPASDVFDLATCLAIGPGLGQSKEALALLRRAITSKLPLLLDADALNLLASHPVLARNLARRTAPTLLTPHPAEAARLLGCDVASVQSDRIAAAQELAKRFTALTVLKGCGSIIALPNGRWFINTSGNAGLASAGSGDVLSGIAAALLAQGWPADLALPAAAHLHGCAADACVAAGIGPIGLSASETIEEARNVMNKWMATTHAQIIHDTSTGGASLNSQPAKTYY